MSAKAVEAFVRLVDARDWVSFVELRRFAEERGVPVAGEVSIEVCPNGVVWAGMSPELVELVEAIREDGRLAWDSGHWLAYLADGAALSLPIAKRAPRDPRKGYAKPRWIPTFFRPRARVIS